MKGKELKIAGTLSSNDAECGDRRWKKVKTLRLPYVECGDRTWTELKY